MIEFVTLPQRLFAICSLLLLAVLLHTELCEWMYGARMNEPSPAFITYTHGQYGERLTGLFAAADVQHEVAFVLGIIVPVSLVAGAACLALGVVPGTQRVQGSCPSCGAYAPVRQACPECGWRVTTGSRMRLRTHVWIIAGSLAAGVVVGWLPFLPGALAVRAGELEAVAWLSSAEEALVPGTPVEQVHEWAATQPRVQATVTNPVNMSVRFANDTHAVTVRLHTDLNKTLDRVGGTTVYPPIGYYRRTYLAAPVAALALVAGYLYVAAKWALARTRLAHGRCPRCAYPLAPREAGGTH